MGTAEFDADTGANSASGRWDVVGTTKSWTSGLQAVRVTVASR